MAFTNVTVSGTFKSPDNAVSSGTVTFQLTEPMRDTADNQIATRKPVVCRLNGAGTFSTTLFATDDTGVAPTGVQYEVTEELDGAIRNYLISLPKANTTVNLADL